MIQYVGHNTVVFELRSGRSISVCHGDTPDLMPGEEKELSAHPLWQEVTITTDTEEEDEQ